MTKETLGHQSVGDIAPKLAELTDDVLFDDVWERPELSKRDRSLITCAALVATGKTEQMSIHFPRAIENGVTKEELVELITHLAFYAGWPCAMSALTRARELLATEEKPAPARAAAATRRRRSSRARARPSSRAARTGSRTR